MFGKGKKDDTTKGKKGTKDQKDVDMDAVKNTTVAGRGSALRAKIEPYKISKNEEFMNEKQLDHFTKILVTWKLELMEEVDQTISELKEASTSVLADPNDRATQEETFTLELRTRDRERKLIKKIEEAIQKIKAKDYGYCDTCGIEIGIRRLEARPTANLCIDCKTLAEIKEKRA